MEHKITASALARRLADVLGRVRYGGETFVVERHGTPIARIGPAAGSPRSTLAEAAGAWRANASDDAFADDLERIGAADRAAKSPWAS